MMMVVVVEEVISVYFISTEKEIIWYCSDWVLH